MKDSNKLTKRILWAMIIGVVLGIALHNFVETPFVDKYLVGFVFKLCSKGFVNAIQMLVVPLVLFSLVVGTSDMGDVAKLGRIGGKIMVLYLGSTAIALLISMAVGFVVRPGVGFDLSQYSETMANYKPGTPTPVVDVFLGIITKNPFASLADGDMLQVIFIALLIGCAITILGSKVERVKEVFTQMNELTLQLVWMVMAFAPYGVFFLAVDTFTKLGFAAFKPLALYMIAAFIALFVHATVSYGSMLTLLVRVSPFQFLKNYADVNSVAFSTASSNAALPIALEAITKKCGVDPKISSFTIPLGCTVNMDGSAVTQAMATVFIAQAYGVNLGAREVVTIVIMATLATIGAAGVPGASMITLAMVLNQVGLPVEAIGIILGVDRILSMTRTCLNVSGDAICAMIVAKSEGMFNKEVFNSRK